MGGCVYKMGTLEDIDPNVDFVLLITFNTFHISSDTLTS